MRIGDQIELEIVENEFPGFGIGYYKEKKIYIKNGICGETIKCRISKKKKGYIEAKILELLKESSCRKEADCPHFRFCGGCSHQMLSYENQLEIKKNEVLKLLEEGGIKDFEFLGIEGSPQEFEYRNKMEFSFGDFEKGGELTLGMHIKEKSFGIVTVDQCMLVDSDFRTILDVVLRYFREKALPYYRIMSKTGYLRNLVLRKGKNTGELMVNFVTTSQIDFDLEEIKEIILSLTLKDKIVSILHTVNDSFSDTVSCDKLEILYGRDHIFENLLGLTFKIYPFAFFQTNSLGAEKLYSIVRSFISESKNKVVFDLYCGTGTIGQITSAAAEKVIGIELIEEAVAAAKENAALNNIQNCEFIAGDIAKVIQDITVKPDIIILDPPRPGVHPTAMEYVIKFDAPEIIYVSCNPKSLVNDLKVLVENGYVVEKVVAMDMFPHTAHTETVVLMHKKNQ